MTRQERLEKITGLTRLSLATTSIHELEHLVRCHGPWDAAEAVVDKCKVRMTTRLRHSVQDKVEALLRKHFYLSK